MNILCVPPRTCSHLSCTSVSAHTCVCVFALAGICFCICDYIWWAAGHGRESGVSAFSLCCCLPESERLTVRGLKALQADGSGRGWLSPRPRGHDCITTQCCLLSFNCHYHPCVLSRDDLSLLLQACIISQVGVVYPRFIDEEAQVQKGQIPGSPHSTTCRL